MRMLARIMLAVLIVGAFAGQILASSVELTGALQYFKPGDSVMYDSGFGAEAQLRLWQNDNFALAVCAGVGAWEIKEQSESYSDGEFGIGVALEGDVALLPIGASVVVSPALADNFKLTLELGLRYVLVESSAELAFAVVNRAGDIAAGSEKIEIDNGVIGVVAANAELELSSGFSLLGGLGYQFDILKGDAKWLGDDIGENELKAFFVRAGMALRF